MTRPTSRDEESEGDALREAVSSEPLSRDDAASPPALSSDDVYAVLATVPDPEVPAISVVDLGIIRDVVVNERDIRVTVTPTYSGCPAMREIEDDIRTALLAHGATSVSIDTVYAPAWTTDWMSDAAREKLRAYGIAPPGPAEHGGLIMLTRRATTVACPFCGSSNTRLQSEFGSTACKAIHVCMNCHQPFDEFKPI